MSSLRLSEKGLCLFLMIRYSSLKVAQMAMTTWSLWVHSVRVGDLARLALDLKDLRNPSTFHRFL